MEIVVLFVALGITWRYLGFNMADVYGGKTMWLAFLERPIYRVLGVDRKVDQTWTRYAASLLIFSRITSSNL